MMKALVICPTCESKGIKRILGEIDTNGFFVVMRFHNGYTKIAGDSFTVICDLCNEPTFFRKVERTGMESYGFIGMDMILSNNGTYSKTISGIKTGTL